MNVGADLVAPMLLHVVHLLGKIDGREKLNARLIIIGPDDQGDGLQAGGDVSIKLFFLKNPLSY